MINDLKNVNKTLTSGFVNEAIEESEKLVKRYNDNSICYYRLGYAYKENKDYDNAILNFMKAKELNPFNQLYQDEITNISNIELLKSHPRNTALTILEFVKSAPEKSANVTNCIFSSSVFPN